MNIHQLSLKSLLVADKTEDFCSTQTLKEAQDLFTFSVEKIFLVLTKFSS